MPLSNLNNDHISIEDQGKVLKAWADIMEVLTRKTRNLKPEERKLFGSVSEQNKLIVLKVLEYNTQQPHLSCPDLDYSEMRQDWNDRFFLAGLINRFVEAMNICDNIRITHDFDAFQNAKLDYDYTKYKMNTAPGAGFESKYNELLQFFKSGGGKKEDEGDKDTKDKPEA